MRPRFPTRSHARRAERMETLPGVPKSHAPGAQEFELMSLYYLDPEREPRACPGCDDCCDCSIPDGYDYCPAHGYIGRCNGTQRLGVDGAKPDIEIVHSPPTWRLSLRGYFYREIGGACSKPDGSPSGPYSTEALALEAARKAAR